MSLPKTQININLMFILEALCAFVGLCPGFLFGVGVQENFKKRIKMYLYAFYYVLHVEQTFRGGGVNQSTRLPLDFL